MEECSTHAATEQVQTAVFTPKEIDSDYESYKPVSQWNEDDLQDYEKRTRNANRWYAWEQLVRLRGKRYENCFLHNFSTSTKEQQSAVERLTGYLRTMRERVTNGEGILLFGPKGAGKDHLLMACARVAIGHDYGIVWANGMEMFADLRQSIGDDARDSEHDIFYHYARTDILWLSDPMPPTGALTGFQQDFLFRVLDYRYSHMRPTWVTCNVASGVELDSRIGAQSGDRLRHNALAIFCNWETYRKTSG